MTDLDLLGDLLLDLVRHLKVGLTRQHSCH